MTEISTMVTTVTMMMEISVMMVTITTFLLTTDMSKTEVFLVQKKVMENTLRVMGDWIDVYQKAENTAPTMMVVTTKILKIYIIISVRPHSATTGSRPGWITANITPDIEA